MSATKRTPTKLPISPIASEVSFLLCYFSFKNIQYNYCDACFNIIIFRTVGRSRCQTPKEESYRGYINYEEKSRLPFIKKNRDTTLVCMYAYYCCKEFSIILNPLAMIVQQLTVIFNIISFQRNNHEFLWWATTCC